MSETRLTDALLRRATRIAEEGAKVQAQLTKAFVDRYGVTYSDVDCDALIDVLDYAGGTPPTVSDCDRLMENCGAKRLATIGQQDGGK